MVHAGFGLFGLLVPLVFLGVIVLVVWALTNASRHPGQYPPPGPPYMPPPGPPPSAGPPQSPLDILQRRFASGEINADEYQKARDLLKDDPPTGR